MKTFAWLYSLLFSSSQPRASPLEISTYFENHSLSVVVQLDNVAGYPVAVHWGGGLLEDIQDSDELQVTCSGMGLFYYLIIISQVLTHCRKGTSLYWNACCN